MRQKTYRRIRTLDAIRYKPAITTLDKKRLFIEQNRLDKPTTRQRIGGLLDRAQGRLTWLRDKIYEHWNPVRNNLTTRGVLRPTTNVKRPFVVMDQRWWIWNIAFSMLPAILIALYCEFIGQHQMYKFHQENELEQMRKLMGEEFVEMNKAALTRPPPEHIGKRAMNVFTELYDFFTGQSSSDSSQDGDTEQATQVLQTAYTPGSPNTAFPTQPTTDDEAGRLNDLKLRLKLLELEILRQEQQQSQTQNVSIRKDEVMKSGIQTRMEKSKMDAWKEAVKNQHVSSEEGESHQSFIQRALSVYSSITEILGTIVDSIRQFVTYVNGFFTESKHEDETPTSHGCSESDAHDDTPTSASTTASATTNSSDPAPSSALISKDDEASSSQQPSVKR